MRRLEFATLLLAAVSLIACGCRQTTGPTNAGPLTPIGPLAPGASLSPVGSQTPILGPFGGPTRVTPPATGSYVAPNNYMGGVVPIDQANRGVNSAEAFATQPNGVIGSGVQVAGWNETNSVVPNAQDVHSSATRDPRSGGMQIIDLTQAPAPPGYRGPAASFPNGFQGGMQNTSPQGWQQGVIPQPMTRQPMPNQSIQSPAFQNPAFQNPAFQNPAGQNPAPQNLFPGGVQTIRTPARGEIANSRAPVPLQNVPSNASPVDSAFPRTATAPPSTEPIRPDSKNVDASQQNLPWRRPGTRF